MAKGYWVAHVDVHDQDTYVKEYVARNGNPIAAHGGKFLVRGGTSQSAEGTLKPRTVVVEFPSYQAALDCLNSPEYQEAVSYRRKAASSDVVVIEGYDGPQPDET
ncbi:MAG: DUF1330 domain-containing protein [Pseudomonadota bacterium]